MAENPQPEIPQEMRELACRTLIKRARLVASSWMRRERRGR